VNCGRGGREGGAPAHAPCTPDECLEVWWAGGGAEVITLSSSSGDGDSFSALGSFGQEVTVVSSGCALRQALYCCGMFVHLPLCVHVCVCVCVCTCVCVCVCVQEE